MGGIDRAGDRGQASPTAQETITDELPLARLRTVPRHSCDADARDPRLASAVGPHVVSPGVLDRVVGDARYGSRCGARVCGWRTLYGQARDSGTATRHRLVRFGHSLDARVQFV